MAKVTVYLPDDLETQVRAAGISMSPVCQRALEQEVRFMTANAIEDQEIAAAAARLIVEEGEEVVRARREGEDDGREWALKTAAPSELRRIQTLVNDPRLNLEDRIRDYTCDGVSHLDVAPFESIRQWMSEWDEQLSFGDEAQYEYWNAFEDAALRIYHKVREAMNVPGHSEGRLDSTDTPYGTPVAVAVNGIDEVWQRILAHEGETFVTVTGIEFKYSVRGSVLKTDRAHWNLSRSTFEKALGMLPVSGPGALNKVVQGPAYVFAVLTDDRIHG